MTALELGLVEVATTTTSAALHLLADPLPLHRGIWLPVTVMAVTVARRQAAAYLHWRWISPRTHFASRRAELAASLGLLMPQVERLEEAHRRADQEYTRLGEEGEVAEVVEGEPVVAYWSDGQGGGAWCRGEVGKAREPGVEVHFTDYGHSQVVQVRCRCRCLTTTTRPATCATSPAPPRWHAGGAGRSPLLCRRQRRSWSRCTSTSTLSTDTESCMAMVSPR